MSKNKKARQAARVRRQKSFPIIWLILAGVLLLFLAVLLGTRRGTPVNFEPEVRGGPSLKADREKVDLGDIRLGEWVEVSFDLTNVGDEALRFTQAPYVEVVEGC
jgi:hypothetical protein